MDDFLQFMMAEDPSAMSAEKQRAMAARLRGLGNVGALGSTSQIAEISGAGKGAMDTAFEQGRAMGDRKQAAEEQASYLRRARATASGRGRGGSVNDLTASERKEMKEMAKSFSIVDAMDASFKDDYANPGGLGLTQSLIQRGMTTEPVLTKALTQSKLGKMVGLDEAQRSGEELEQEQEWWRQYERMSKIPDRAREFGATLTKEELASWNNADIKPGQTPTQIRRNLAIRKAIARGWMQQVADFNVALGFPQEAVDVLFMGMGKAPEGNARSLMQEGLEADYSTPRTSQDAIEQPSEDTLPVGVDLEEWMELTPRERAEYFELQQYME